MYNSINNIGLLNKFSFICTHTAITCELRKLFMMYVACGRTVIPMNEQTHNNILGQQVESFSII